MSKTITVFTVEGFPNQVLFTTPENFSRVLIATNIDTTKVHWSNITFETIDLLLRGGIQCKSIDLSNEIR